MDDLVRFETGHRKEFLSLSRLSGGEFRRPSHLAGILGETRHIRIVGAGDGPNLGHALLKVHRGLQRIGKHRGTDGHRSREPAAQFTALLLARIPRLGAAQEAILDGGEALHRPQLLVQPAQGKAVLLRLRLGFLRRGLELIKAGDSGGVELPGLERRGQLQGLAAEVLPPLPRGDPQLDVLGFCLELSYTLVEALERAPNRGSEGCPDDETDAEILHVPLLFL